MSPVSEPKPGRIGKKERDGKTVVQRSQYRVLGNIVV
jgi:hypothetical protein